MTLPPAIQKLGYSYSQNRNGMTVCAIIAHNTVGWDSRAYLASGGGRQVSIHALIQKSGVLFRSVPDALGANHAGFGTMPAGLPQVNPNLCTMSFELENASDGISRVDPYTNAQLLTMGWEINRIRAKFGRVPILRHADIDPHRRKDTAGLTVADMEAWALKAAAQAKPPATFPALYRAKTQTKVYERSQGNGNIAGYLAAGRSSRSTRPTQAAPGISAPRRPPRRVWASW